MARQRPVDLDTQLKDIRRQMSDQLGCLDFRMESKLSLLGEFQEFFKRRGEVEYEYARSLERLCEKFERSTKQRNIRNEVRSTFNLWSALLAETRKLSRERASLAETMASEMVARLDIMAKDVHVLTKKCREICVEVQDHFLKELRDLGEQTKVYHHSCYNAHEAHNKLMKSKEKVEGARSSTQRRKKALEKEAERQKQYKTQRHFVMKNRNDMLLDITKCNAFSMQYFNMDVMDMVEYMDYDYHSSFERLAAAYKEAESETCEAVMACASTVMDQAKGLNFENDLHYFLSENPGPFTPPNPFSFQPYEGDDVSEYKVNTQDVFERAQKSVQSLHANIQTLEIQREEDVKTVQHMEQVNLRKYRITSVEDALAVMEEAGEPMAMDQMGQSRGSASLDRGLSYQTRGGQAITLSQRGKKDSLYFTLGVLQRRVNRSDRLALAHSQLDILEKSLDEQKIPPVPVGVDSKGQSVPGEVPQLFGGNMVEYLKATGSETPLIVSSCIRAIDKEGLDMEGLFRVPGPAAYTEELRKAFEEGRDPLLYVGKKVDIAAVASVLKSYFRELSIPLFPTDNYKAFIKCTRHEDVASRLEAVQNTLTLVDPPVVKVMKYLFKFLFRVSLYHSENKMTTANLALVFGPTLTRAPPEVDPRQLHNDVPSVNLLIQLCIDHHEQVFGEDEEEAGMMAPPPSYSPPHESPVWPGESTVSPPPAPPSQPLDDVEEPPSPLASPPSPPPPEEVTSPLHVPRTPSPPPELTPPAPESAPPPPPPDIVSPPPPAPAQEEAEEQPPAEQPLSPQGGEGKGAAGTEQKKTLTEQGNFLSGEWSALDEQVKDIQASLELMQDQEPPGIQSAGEGEGKGGEAAGEGEGKGGEAAGEEGHGSESDSDSEDEEEAVMSVSARALYDYPARSDKELSFKRGDMLKVIEKSHDGHWWDGLSGDRRGFIPVAYVEIIELQSVTPTEELAVIPPPPARRSSMQDRKEGAEGVVVQVSEPPNKTTISELHEPAQSKERSCSPEPPRVTLTPEPEAAEKEGVVKDGDKEGDKEKEKEGEKSREGSPIPQSEPPKEEPPPQKPTVHIPTGSVKSLSSRFAQPPPQQVLVQPHRRHQDLSPRMSYDPPRPAAAEVEPINRSSSTSSTGRVTQLTEQFKHKVPPGGPPPPTKPRPPAHVVSPGADRGTAVFHITPHSSTTGSPLQQAQLGSQLTPKAAPGKATPSKAGRGSSRRDKGQKKEDRPPLPSKPLTKPLTKPPPPKAPNELRAELQAAVGKRRPTDK